MVSQDSMNSWQASLERRTVLPIKWALWSTALGFWFLTHPNHPVMPVAVFALFTVVAMGNLGLTYLWLAGRVASHQVQPVSLASWALDLAFVCGLVVMEQQFYPGAQGPVTDFHLFFFVLVLRGFSLFRTPRQNLAANLIVVAAFVATLVSLPGGWSPMVQQTQWIRGVFILLLVVMSWMIVDILEQQKRAMAAVEARLAQSETFGLLGRLAGSLAHEMNNPMGIIAAQADYLLKRADKSDPRAEDYAVLSSEAHRCGRILSSLMQFSRSRLGQDAVVDLAALADEVSGLLPSQRVRVTRNEEDAAGSYEVLTEPSVARLAVLAAVIYGNSLHVDQADPVTVHTTVDHQAPSVIVTVQFHPAVMDSNEASSYPFLMPKEGEGPRPGLKAVRQAMEALAGELREERSDEEQVRRISLVFPRGN